jgi:hypothetical protein
MPVAPSQPALTPWPRHRNSQLFSDHFLENNLPTRPDWQMLAVQALPVRERLRAILAAYQPSSIEAQTEHDLVRPVLDALGHTFEVQPSLKTPDGSKTPDYMLYNDAQARAGLKGRLLDDTLLKGAAFGVAEAKYWDRPLDRALTGAGDAFNNKNPAYQIAFYLQHAGVTWGILTNGRLWRLVHKDTAHKLDRYYEVDLPELLGRDDPADFLYFYAFFRRAAFDRGEDGLARPLGLDTLLAASTDYSHAIGEGLKAQVYEALRHLAQGFLDYAPNGLTISEHPERRRDEVPPQSKDAPSPDTLKTIYDHSLIVLYRLLFVFYAEARDLLPLAASPSYRSRYSLHSITRDVARDRTTGIQTLPDSGSVWQKLRDLFRIINAGSPPLEVATFNGGLFDPARYPFLERNAVGDAHLQAALDCLARVKGQFIDYRDLSERHLGTIYEGLLEHHLRPIAPEAGWTVDLFNDRGERKRTGSYYTPDAIVKYIVEQTVGRALTEAVAAIPEEDAVRRVAAVLHLNVLDPAMGSGHFLVEVVEHIARFLVDLGAQAADPGEPDLAYWKRRVAQSCVYGVDLNPLAVDLAKLSLWLSTAAKDRPLSFLDHHLRVGNSLVGARLADLGTAGSAPAAPDASQRKAARRAAKAAAQAQAAGQASMLDDDAFRQSLSLAVDFMWLIEGIAGVTLAEVKQQEQLYLGLRETLARRYGLLADLATARRFGLKVDVELAPRLAEYAAGKSVARFPQFDALLAEVSELAERERFFHWELEFPEVFFDKHGYTLGDRAGFDVVVGNPPYVRQERLAPYKPYLADSYKSYHSVADLYLYFYERGVELLQIDGRLGFISSGTFARANFAAGFRKWLPGVARIESIIDFGENQPFEDAEMVRPSILVLGRHPQETPFRSLFIADRVPSSLTDAIATGIDCDLAVLQQPEWTFQPALHTRLLARILASGRPLKGTLHSGLYRGLTIGLNEAFVIDEAAREAIVADGVVSAVLVRPSVKGEDLRPWYQEDEGRSLIVIPAGWTRAHYGANLSEEAAWERLRGDLPALTDHLSRFADAARLRQDKGDYWWELRPCDYYDAFDRPKIFWPDISKLPRFSWDEAGKYITNTGYVVPTDDKHLLGILASRVTWFVISQVCQPLRLRAGLWQYRLLPQFMGRLPIPELAANDEATLSSLVENLMERSRSRYALHHQTRHRILTDLGRPGGKLNLKLTSWWQLDFPAFRAELQKAFGSDIPLKQRDEWESWLDARGAEHARLTAEIVRLETDLNAQVYRLFDLSSAEIKIIEESTKYKYGEV